MVPALVAGLKRAALLHFKPKQLGTLLHTLQQNSRQSVLPIHITYTIVV